MIILWEETICSNAQSYMVVCILRATKHQLYTLSTLIWRLRRIYYRVDRFSKSHPWWHNEMYPIAYFLFHGTRPVPNKWITDANNRHRRFCQFPHELIFYCYRDTAVGTNGKVFGAHLQRHMNQVDWLWMCALWQIKMPFFWICPLSTHLAVSSLLIFGVFETPTLSCSVSFESSDLMMSQKFHLFVFTDNDPTIGGNVTVKITASGGRAHSSPWWSLTMAWIERLL